MKRFNARAIALPFSALLAAHGLSLPHADSYTVVQNSVRKGQSRTFSTIVAEKDHTRIELETQSPIEAAEAKRISDSEYAVIQSLYGPRQTPYEGEVSEVMSCAEEDKPQTVREKFLGAEEKVLLADAGARYSYGVCSKDLVAYRSGFVASTRNKTFYELRIFVPAEPGHAKKEYQAVRALIGEFRELKSRR